ncbi:transposase domain-containing protein [Streptomyces sp. CA-106131]|uniref:transposase domain-containing protein n=1 Tax=Streptomyces sp. CA-106131 TaxID=3240045 RepID=UPI003D8ED7F2
MGLLSRTFTPELVDFVVDEAGAREERTRSLPSRLVVYFVLTCATRRGCAVRRGESKEVRDLLARLSQQPGGS